MSSFNHGIYQHQMGEYRIGMDAWQMSTRVTFESPISASTLKATYSLQSESVPVTGPSLLCPYSYSC